MSDSSLGPDLDKEHITIVIPVLNEAATIVDLIAEISTVLRMRFTRLTHSFIVVDDGSWDGTSEAIRNSTTARSVDVMVITLRRNFGKEAAMLAGIEFALKGNCTRIALLDGDGQHPVDDLCTMITLSFTNGRSVVGVQDYSASSTLYRLGTATLRRFIRGGSSLNVPAGISDFRVLTREAALDYLALRERERYLRDLFDYNGSPLEYFEYSVSRRSDSTKSRWSRTRLVSYAATLVSSRGSQILPRLMVFTTALVSVVSLYAFATTVVSLLQGDRTGVPSILFTLVLFQLGTIMLLFFIAAIVVTILIEVKQRPTYIVDKIFRSNELN